MVSAKLQSVATKQQWKAGTIPVPQFPDSVFAGAAYKVLRSRSHDVLLDVQMGSTNPSVTKSLDLLIEMKPVGGHWIVVSAAPRNSTAVPSAVTRHWERPRGLGYHLTRWLPAANARFSLVRLPALPMLVSAGVWAQVPSRPPSRHEGSGSRPGAASAATA